MIDRHGEERRRQHLAAVQVEDLDRAGLLDDEQPAGVARRRRHIERLVSPLATRVAAMVAVAYGRIRIEAVDQVVAIAARQHVAAVVAGHDVHRHVATFVHSDWLAPIANAARAHASTRTDFLTWERGGKPLGEGRHAHAPANGSSLGRRRISPRRQPSRRTVTVKRHALRQNASGPCIVQCGHESPTKPHRKAPAGRAGGREVQT